VAKPVIRILGCVILLGGILAAPAFAQDCRKCGPRVIVGYDFDVAVQPPVDPKDKGWQQLLQISDGYVSQVQAASKNSPECIAIMPARFPAITREGDQPSDPKFRLGLNRGASADFDYLMYGSLAGSEGHYTATLHLITGHTREGIASSTTTFATASEALWKGQMLALSLGATDRGSKPLRQVIDDWEKKRRAENPKVALNAKVEWVNPPARAKLGEVVTLHVNLVDCDGHKFFDRIVTVFTAAGEIQPPVIRTDANGDALVFFIPKKNGDASLKVEYPFDYPSEKIGYTGDIRHVQIGDPINKLDAQLVVKSHGVKQYQKPGDAGYQKEEQNWEMTTDVVLDISADKAVAIATNPDSWKKCAEATTLCEVAAGSNRIASLALDQQEPQRFPVKVSIQENSWRQMDNALQQTYRMSTANRLPDGLVNLHIAFMPPGVMSPPGSPELADLRRKYRIVISGVSMYQGRDAPYPDKAEAWDDSSKKWDDVSKDRKVMLRAWSALSSTEYQEPEEGDQIQYAVIEDANGLEDYFTNPQGTRILSAKAMVYVKANGWLEEHWITLTLSPHVARQPQK
jgi:hypothetical protein